MLTSTQTTNKFVTKIFAKYKSNANWSKTVIKLKPVRYAKCRGMSFPKREGTQRAKWMQCVANVKHHPRVEAYSRSFRTTQAANSLRFEKRSLIIPQRIPFSLTRSLLDNPTLSAGTILSCGAARKKKLGDNNWSIAKLVKLTKRKKISKRITCKSTRWIGLA